MNQEVLEILLPVNQKLQDEDAFRTIDLRMSELSVQAPFRKCILFIAMEMFQNLKRHANPHHLSILRIRRKRNRGFEISSFNFADSQATGRLTGKHSALKKTADYRQAFREKLAQKMHGTEAPGNLGLDLCFRNSSSSRLQAIPFSDHLTMIYLSFSLNYGEIVS